MLHFILVFFFLFWVLVFGKFRFFLVFSHFKFSSFVTFWVVEVCHILSFMFFSSSHFKFLNFVNYFSFCFCHSFCFWVLQFWVLSHSEFCHIRSFFFVFCHILSFKFCQILSLWVMSQLNFFSWNFFVKNIKFHDFFV